MFQFQIIFREFNISDPVLISFLTQIPGHIIS